MLVKDASHTAVQPDAVYVNETPVPVVDGGRSPTEARAAATTASAAAAAGTAATTIITEVIDL